ncbi:MAG: sensor histidine kinase [Blautia sp.]|jgi:signal transduction histidine kinase
MIFRKLHIQLTILFTLVTGLVIAAMTCVCLYISEADRRENSYTAFVNDMNSILDYLENQPVLSLQWIREIEQRYGLSLEILDNQKPLFISALEDERSLEELFSSAKKTAKEQFEIEALFSSDQEITEHVEFSMKTEDQKKYYACVAWIPKKEGGIQVTSLYPLDNLYRQFSQGRLYFLLAAVLAVLVLGIFSWFYTGRLLAPIEQNQKRQTQFIAAASHELRAPLAVILSSLSAMKIADETDIPRFYQAIESEGNRMSRLVEDMLSLANADNQTWSVTLHPAELDTLLLQAYESYEPIAAKKQIHLQISLPWDAVEPCPLDEARILQVLSILLDNAVSYTPSGGCIELSLEKKKEFYQITVADNGPGIPDDQKDSVFRRFYRADSAHHDREHFGLGLCIAEEIIRLHHGRITVMDTPGGGASFLVLLPQNTSLPSLRK